MPTDGSSFTEFVRLSVRDRVARLRDGILGIRVPTSSPEELPEGGDVAVRGRVEPAEELLRSPVTDVECVLAHHRLEARSDADSRGGVFWDRINAVSFHVVDGSGGDGGDGAGGVRDGDGTGAGEGDRALVDPIPRSPENDFEPGPRSQGRAAYADATLDFPGAADVREVWKWELDRDDPLAEFVDPADLPDEALLRYTERRFEPGHRVSVLGHRLPEEHFTADLAHVAGLRTPFRLSGWDPVP